MSAGKIGAVLERKYVTKSVRREKSMETTKTVFHSKMEGEFIYTLKADLSDREKNIHVFIFQVFASAAVISLDTLISQMFFIIF